MLLAYALATAAVAASPEAAAISEVLQTSARAWSAGDLDGFMRSYEDSPQTVFVTRKGPVRGFAAIRARFQARYGGKATAGYGALTFGELEVRPLGPDWAIAYGRYHLVADPAKPEETGVFDLLMHRTAQGWRIASDHTS